MKSFRIAVLLLIVLAFPGVSQSAAEQRTALVIGNSHYSTGLLKNPVNDATDTAAALRKAGFAVNLKKAECCNRKSEYLVLLKH